MIRIKNEKEIQAMREGGKILAEIMEKIHRQIFPGQSTAILDKLAEELVFASGGEAAFKGFGKETGHPYPGNICASLNAEIVHGIPSAKRIVKEGDILKIDIGLRYKGMVTDMARTFPVGKISPKARKLIKVTEQSFWEGVKKLRAGKFLSQYSQAVQHCAESQGFFVVRNLVGHGVGRELHEDPYVPNYYEKGSRDLKLVPGLTLALEPMINEGTVETILEKNGWVFKTRDGKLSAHYENTVLVGKNSPEILTIF